MVWRTFQQSLGVVVEGRVKSGTPSCSGSRTRSGEEWYYLDCSLFYRYILFWLGDCYVTVDSIPLLTGHLGISSL